MTTMSDNEQLSCSSSSPTKLIHYSYEGNFELHCTAEVLSCRFIDECSASSSNGNETRIIVEPEASTPSDGSQHVVEIQLDVTTMHPQGGGQPTDTGTISAGTETAHIHHVALNRDTKIVTHTGTTTAFFDVGTSVKVSVDPKRRLILSECHTAGHVVDAAMAKCNYVLPPIKGYHFLDGPYVEYRGSIPANERDPLLKQLTQAFQELIHDDIPTSIQLLSKHQADELCNARLQQNFDFSEYAPEEKVRVVTVAGWSCPCGGTHVKSTSDLKRNGWTVVGLKCKKDVVRVRYGMTSKSSN